MNKTVMGSSYLHNGISYTGQDGIFILNRGPVLQLMSSLRTLITTHFPYHL